MKINLSLQLQMSEYMICMYIYLFRIIFPLKYLLSFNFEKSQSTNKQNEVE
jgi:hypothetical protein